MLYMKYTNGTKLTVGLGYIKFYFHGITFYITKKPIRVGGSVLFLENLNLTFPVEMGINQRLTFIKNDVTYIPCTCNGLRVLPWSGQTLTNYQEDTQYSLMWRIVKTFINTTSSGKQTGDNWANYEATEFYNVATREFRFQEVGCYDASNNSKSILNVNLSLSLSTDTGGMDDDEYPLVCQIKNYTTIYEE